MYTGFTRRQALALFPAVALAGGGCRTSERRSDDTAAAPAASTRAVAAATTAPSVPEPTNAPPVPPLPSGSAAWLDDAFSFEAAWGEVVLVQAWHPS